MTPAVLKTIEGLYILKYKLFLYFCLKHVIYLYQNIQYNYNNVSFIYSASPHP